MTGNRERLTLTFIHNTHYRSFSNVLKIVCYTFDKQATDRHNANVPDLIFSRGNQYSRLHQLGWFQLSSN